MTKDMLKKYNARTRASNAAFAKMTPEQKKVTVAKDVLEQLRVGRLVATNGTYLKSPTFDGGELDDGDDLREAFKKMESCDVCAIGAVFVATVDRLDKLTVGDLDYRYCATDDTMRQYLDREGVFTQEELEAMENAFEWGAFSQANDSRTRMEEVMNAIVACGGVDIVSALNYDPEWCGDADHDNVEVINA